MASMRIDGKDISAYGMDLISYTTPSFPVRKFRGVDLPNRHGLYKVSSPVSSRTISAEVLCKATTPEEVRDKVRRFFAAMFANENDHHLVFTDDLKIHRLVSLDDPSDYRVIKGILTAYTILTLNFTMSDPFLYENALSVTRKTVLPGVPIKVINDGFECPMRLIIKHGVQGSGTNISNIVVNVNDEEIRYNSTITGTTELVFDTGDYTVKIDGIEDINDWSGSMPQLKSGDNIITIGNYESLSLYVSVEFTKRWI